ncbi:MAG: hypothetical protein ABR608_11775 [Pseudonocardiaceae bacterium]
MVPTLGGRIQTRIAVLVVIGGLWTLLITPLLPCLGGLPTAYRGTFLVLTTVLVLGVAWELVYHFLQQFRWEKDWPTLFGLLTGINEGVLVWVLIELGVVPGAPPIPRPTFVIHFATVWLVTWLWVNGPMRVPFIRWRFRGGKLVG